MPRLLLFGLLVGSLSAQAVPAGDARRGAELFRIHSCIQCHTVSGTGGGRGVQAPDLAVRRSREYSPATLAALMWNHAPRMFAAMQRESIVRREMTEQNAADLFAYFYAAGFFERPGDAGRGKAIFSAKGCSGCHAGNGPGKAVGEWRAGADPIALATQMWNHIGHMDEAAAKRKMERAHLSSQEIRDLALYIQTLPQNRGRLPDFALAPPADGEQIFRDKGCLECHQGKSSLDGKLAGQTVVDIAASMWNHGSRMVRMPPVFTEQEMRQLLSYVWATQFLDGSGDATRGQTVFAGKKCAGCHNGVKAPQMPRTGSPFNSSLAIVALWKHGDSMLNEMRQQNIPWPQFKVSEMADLVRFLNGAQK